MKDIYTTLKFPGEAEFEEKKSRFIGCAAPVFNEDEALAFIKNIKSKYKKARHYVYAYVLCSEDGVIISRYSDDGEPQGTAGLPVLNALQSQCVENAVAVVVRYFGGILLGASGLTRAYRKAALIGINACGAVKKVLYDEVFVRIDYQVYNSVRFLLTGGANDEIANSGFKIINEEFSDEVLIHLYTAVGDTEKICNILTEAAQGKICISIDRKKGRYTE